MIALPHIVKGFDRPKGGGPLERFTEIVQAATSTAARQAAQAKRYAAGREHVECITVERLKPEHH